MWATWSIEGEQINNPFPFIQKNSPYEVRLHLALPLNRLEIPSLLLFIYDASEVVLYRPTIADNPAPEFCPPPLDILNHGMSAPHRLEPSEIQSYCNRANLPSNFSPQPRPEAVHMPISFKKVAKVIELPY